MHPGNRRGARPVVVHLAVEKCQQRFGSLLGGDYLGAMRRGGGSTPLVMGEGTEAEGTGEDGGYVAAGCQLQYRHAVLDQFSVHL